jgi:hypothetical protein
MNFSRGLSFTLTGKADFGKVLSGPVPLKGKAK